jgi:hypothetical protein
MLFFGIHLVEINQCVVAFFVIFDALESSNEKNKKK